MTVPGDMACAELVERVTAYLEGELDEHDHTRVELHLVGCGGCEAYVGQMRATVGALRSLGPTATEPAAVEALLDAFRTWRDE